MVSALLAAVLVVLLVVVYLLLSQLREGSAQRLDVNQLVEGTKTALAQQSALSEQQLKGRQEQIDRSVEEVRRSVEALGKRLGEYDTAHASSFSRLESMIGESRQQTELLRQQTTRLNEVLAGNQSRGQWGERMAEDVLRLAGLQEGVQYFRERPLPDGGRPDFTFNLGGRLLHMDVKTPMANFQRYLEAPAEGEREEAAKAFETDLIRHIDGLAKRSYGKGDPDTYESVLLFVPNEQIYAFIHERDRQRQGALLARALQQGVVLCSPLTLFAVLAVIRQTAAQEAVARETKAVLDALAEFEREWDRFKAQMEKVAKKLGELQNAFSDLQSTRSRGLERRLDRLAKLREGGSGDLPPAPGGGGAEGVAMGPNGLESA